MGFVQVVNFVAHNGGTVETLLNTALPMDPLMLLRQQMLLHQQMPLRQELVVPGAEEMGFVRIQAYVAQNTDGAEALLNTAATLPQDPLMLLRQQIPLHQRMPLRQRILLHLVILIMLV